jgi:hydrogenase/urease accessory protein HupE
MLVGTLLTTAAEAHLVTTGLGPIYDGISHVLLSLDDLVPVLTMALLGGLNGPTPGRRTLFALTGAWLVGGIAGFLIGLSPLPGAATTASFLALGSLTAADRRLSPVTVAALAIAVGLLHGWLNGAGLTEARGDILELTGIVGAIFVLVAISAACAVSLQSAWARLLVRVAGSWVAASGLLVLALRLRGI